MPQSFNDTGSDQGSNQGDETQGTFTNQQGTAGDQQQGQGDGNGNSQSVDVQSLQKRVNDSQKFIDTLKGERAQDRAALDQLKAELAQRPSLEEIMEHINQQAGTNSTSIDPDDLINRTVEAVTQRTTAKEKAAQEKSNITSVASVLAKEFAGEDLDAKVAAIAAENGMTFEDVFQLAAKTPKAALKLLGIKSAPSQSGTGNAGSVNTQGLTKQNGESQSRTSGNIMGFRNDRDRIAYMNAKFKNSGIE